MFRWTSICQAIDDHLTKLSKCHKKWTQYEKHRNEVTDRVAKVEERAGSLPAAVFAGETSYQPDIDRIQVCVMSYFINILVQFLSCVSMILIYLLICLSPSVHLNECRYCQAFLTLWLWHHSGFRTATPLQNSKGSPVSGGAIYALVGKFCDFRLKLPFLSWKQYEIGPWLSWITSRKS